MGLIYKSVKTKITLGLAKNKLTFIVLGFVVRLSKPAEMTGYFENFVIEERR